MMVMVVVVAATVSMCLMPWNYVVIYAMYMVPQKICKKDVYSCLNLPFKKKNSMFNTISQNTIKVIDGKFGGTGKAHAPPWISVASP